VQPSADSADKLTSDRREREVAAIGNSLGNEKILLAPLVLLSYAYTKCCVPISSLIFKDPMTTAAAINRLVHHRTIVKLNVSSCRLEEAQDKQRQPRKPLLPKRNQPKSSQDV